MLLSITVIAQQPAPKLGLTLSGGGAKGLAHIGVLKVLEEEGIEPHFISGTSMGSIVGGLYAIGYTTADLERLAKETPWLDYFNDDASRNAKPIEAKEIKERYQFSFPFEDGKIQVPKGFIKGTKMSMLLAQLTSPVHDVENFDDYYIPFRCLATDLVTGEGHLFDSGSLADAMRSSACIPTVFEPMEIGDKTLIDGMFVRNLPVEDVKNMGADLVIAVDVGAPLATKEELTSFLGVLGQTTSFGMVRSTLEQQKLSDVLIMPDLNDQGALDFSSVDSLIAIGERAARKKLPEIRALKKKLAIVNRSQVKRNKIRDFPLNLNITSIKFAEEASDSTTLLRLLKIKTPQVLTHGELVEKMMGMYASGFFTFVDYKLLPEENGYQLFVRTKMNSNVYVRAGGFYDTNINAAILLNTTIRNLLVKGSRLSLDLRVSETPGIFLDYLIHTNTRPNFGFRIDGKWNFYPGDYYENNNLADGFAMQHAADQIGLYSGISNHSSLWLGWGTEIFVQKEVFTFQQFENVNLSQSYLFFEYSRDKLNRKYFPTKGYKIGFNGKYILSGKLRNRVDDLIDQNTNDNYYGQIEYRQIFPLGKHTSLQWFNQGGYAQLKQSNYINLFYLGNDLPYQKRLVDFVGFDYMEQLANRYAFSGLKFQIEPSDGYFLSATANYGYFELDDFNLVQEGTVLTKSAQKDYIAGVGLEAGILIRQFGPIKLASEYNVFTKNFNIYLRLGYSF